MIFSMGYIHVYQIKHIWKNRFFAGPAEPVFFCAFWHRDPKTENRNQIESDRKRTREWLWGSRLEGILYDLYAYAGGRCISSVVPQGRKEHSLWKDWVLQSATVIVPPLQSRVSVMHANHTVVLPSTIWRRQILLTNYKIWIRPLEKNLHILYQIV